MLLVQAFIALLIVLLLGRVLSKIPLLKWGWTKLLPDEEGSNIVLVSMKIKYIGIIVAIILIFNLPKFARIEEEIFR